MRHAEPVHAPGMFNFFAYHGAWSPGVRLFRKVNLTTKVLFVSLAFMLLITLLLAGYLKPIRSR